MSDNRNHGGWYAVICLHVSWLTWIGILKGLGIMLPTLKEQFKAETWLIGWMLAIVDGTTSISGIFAAPLESIFGARAVILASGFMLGVSLIIASFATSVVQLTVVLALGVGPAIGVVMMLSKGMISRCFKTNYATANSVAHAGIPIGLILMAPLVHLFLDTYGWRGALLLISGISSHITVCGALLRTQSHELYLPLPSREESTSKLRRDKETISRIQFLKEVAMTTKRSFGVSVCLQKSFWISAIIYVYNYFLFLSWNIYYVDNVLSKGFSAENAIVFCTVAGVSRLIGRLLNGPIVEAGILKLRTFIVILVISLSISVFTDPWMNTYWLAMMNVAIFSISGAALASLNDVFTKELIGPNLLTCAFSWLELVTGIALPCIGFIPGLVHDKTGSYKMAYVMMGCACVPALVALVAENLWTKEPNPK